jgi:hypothetical protein
VFSEVQTPYFIFFISNVLPVFPVLLCAEFTKLQLFIIAKYDEVPIKCSTVVGNHKDESEAGEIHRYFYIQSLVFVTNRLNFSYYNII